MNGPDEWRDELATLCEAAIEGRLTADQKGRLEHLVLVEPAARRVYVEYLHLHASLTWSAGDPAFLEPGRSPAPGRFVTPSGPPGRPDRPGGQGGWRRPLRLVGLAAAAALLVAVVWQIRPSRTGPAPTFVATLAEGEACKWGGGSLPTESGSRLPAGRLRLAEGVARLAFDSGAELTLEAPADLELVSPGRCILHAGRLVGKVPPRARGFTVETPTAVVEDLGTEFGVNVPDGRSADVQVFDGRVDVRHRGTGRMLAMKTGANRRFGPEGSAEFNPLTERPSTAWPPPRSADEATRILDLSTAMGRGKDTYVQPPVPTKKAPDALLLVKNTTQDEYGRKAYAGIDLATVKGLTITDARLSLTFAPTGLGFASEVPDSSFAVYGLIDEALDGWDERALRWHDAPANRPDGAELDPEKVALLGRFEIRQGVLDGTRSISGEALVDFLNGDTNSLATFIIVRETKGSGRSDLVHGFAGKHHPQLPPPTLKLTAIPRR